MPSPKVIQVEDASHVAEVRRYALAIAATEGLGQVTASNSAIVATELATNLIKHAKKGEIHLLGLSERGPRGIEILSIDRGPGISDLQKCLKDGFSTSGTLGTGLGAVKRLSNFMEFYSLPGRGTILATRLSDTPLIEGTVPDVILGVAAKPIRGESVSGDAWATRVGRNFQLMLIADGLGHGPDAAEASSEAVRIFSKSSADSVVELVQAIHNALKGTRGAAVSIAKLEFDRHEVRFAGLGNVAGIIASGTANTPLKSMVTQYGTAGHQARQVKEFIYQTEPGDTVIMHSDGLSSHWNLQLSPGLLRKSPVIVASSLYRDYARERDDVCVIAGTTR